ncbi:hypothetical protein H5P28_01740 [Ruficoccus amylovorans]|uniref:SCP domain-containing protein n=1 Tax=Ruficoccus amylovorans TaxID=1804625 RepID=A0A842H982_9BACT|nr:hypothetical protein [Ruficoccus amylovorans]MBC2592972.1 hypothetical protein [Ruficoccus amylovorans]
MTKLALLTAFCILPASFPAVFATPVSAPPPAWRMSYPDPALPLHYQEEETFFLTSFGFRAASTGESASTLAENAEGGTTGFSIDISSESFEVVQDLIALEGEHSFHLFHSDGTDSSLTLASPVAVTAGMKLFFESWLRYSTQSQIARVQLSTDDGATWPVTLYSLPGSGGETELSPSLQQLDLSPYAGETVRLRFLYESTGSYYPLTAPEHEPLVGWFFDNIQVGTSFIKRPYSIGDPSDDEQYYLELINRARADANAEAQRLAAPTDPDVIAAMNHFGVSIPQMIVEFADLENNVQPLAFNKKLLASARLHTQDMRDHVFQDHTSSPDAPAPNQPGDTPGDRATRQGYDFSYIGENIYLNALSVTHGHAAFEVDWGDDANDAPAYAGTVHDNDGMQDAPGHRLNLHNPLFKEAGIGILNTTGPLAGPQVVTQDFGQPQADTAYITGVIFDDSDGGKSYATGEGAGGVRVDVDGSVYYAISTTSGGYAVPVYRDGTYTVTFTAPGYPVQTRTVTVTNLQNVKVDWRRLRLNVETVTHSPGGLTSITFDPENESPGATFTLLKATAPGGPYSAVPEATPSGPSGPDNAYIYTYQHAPGEDLFFRILIQD